MGFYGARSPALRRGAPALWLQPRSSQVASSPPAGARVAEASRLREENEESERTRFRDGEPGPAMYKTREESATAGLRYVD